MRRRTLAVLCLLAVVTAILGLTSGAAHADTLTVDLRIDTWVDKAHPSNAVQGDDPALLMNNDPTKTKWAYARVPASDFNLPAGAVTSKTEILFRPLQTDAVQTISVFPQANCTWSSAQVSWNTAQSTYPPGPTAIGSATGTTANVDKVVDAGNYITGNGDWCVVLKTSFANSKNQNRSVQSSNGGAFPVRARITYSTTAPTTTTSAATTTTGAMPTTTVTMGGCAPITISTGGVYTGCYESTNPATPAVTINTTQPVTLDRATIRHAGRGVKWGVSGIQITITNSAFQRLDPGSFFNGRAIDLFQPASVVIEHNRLIDGDGILWNGDSSTPTLGRVRYNEAFNIGRYRRSGGGFVQFFQADKVTLGGFELAWNHVVNQYGQSEVEDNVNMFASGGTSGNPMDLHHNLIDGAYDDTGNPTGDGYSGGGIICGDGTPAGSWVTIRDNYFVSTSNYGGSIYGGSNQTLLRNRAVSDSFTDTGVLHSPTFGNGFMAWDGNSTGTMTGIVVQDNVAGWVRRTGVGTNTERANFWLPEAEDGDPGDSATGNTTLASPIDTTDEQAERDAWEAARVAAGVTVGPLP